MRTTLIALVAFGALSGLAASERRNLEVRRLAIVNGKEIPVAIPVEAFLGLSLDDKGRADAALLARDYADYAKDCRQLSEKAQELQKRWEEFAANNRVPLP